MRRWTQNAVFEIDGVGGNGVPRKHMNVVAASGESSGEIAGQAADSADNAWGILLAEQADRELIRSRQQDGTSFELAGVSGIGNVGSGVTTKCGGDLRAKQSARAVPAKIDVLANGDIDVFIERGEDGGIDILLGDVPVNVVAGFMSQLGPTLEEFHGVARFLRRVFQREVDAIADDGKVVGVDA